MRWQAADSFELGISAKVYGNLDFEVDDASYTGYDVIGVFKLNPTVSLFASYSDRTLDIDGDELEFSGISRFGVRLGF